MLEKPNLKDEKIVACLENDFGLSIKGISFLPLGADLETAVYRVIAVDETHYFLKLRQGDVDKALVAVPKFLSDQGIEQIVPSLPSKTGQLWATLDPFKVILYPFIEGHDGCEAKMSDQQWVEFGVALKSFHTTHVPLELTSGIQHEAFSPKWREIVKSHLMRIDDETYEEPVAVEIADFLRAKHDETLELVKRVERLAQALQARPPEFILCHGDIHLWNLLIDVKRVLCTFAQKCVIEVGILRILQARTGVLFKFTNSDRSDSLLAFWRSGASICYVSSQLISNRLTAYWKPFAWTRPNSR